ncbi:MAG TPA: chromosomal replication initiator protein DnaA [Acidimicrobiales bacterium]|nr:chromosomal replication initiator protein DnaA [Acidimicrobiales bacterium]
MTNAERLWILCSQALRTQVTEATWRAWFDGVTPVSADERVLVLAVPSSLAKERIEARYLALVRDLLTDATGLDLEVRLEVVPGSAAPEDSGGLLSRAGWEEESAATGLGPSGTAGNGSPSPPPPPPGREDTPLNPRYTFEAFVIGSSNRFAHAAALSVAETPAKSYNPLFIHGFAGLGKTHLLHAIGNYVRENFPARHVRYVSTETFMNEFVDAIRTNTTTAFKRRYRECDVLLVDDIQFMENKEGLQEEFFHTFNSLYGASKQIVITSDRPPKSIATLEDRLRSRFLSGLITDVQPPELETRLAILRKKAEGERTQVPDEVLDFIATHVKDNIRELEGAFIRVSAFASLNREPLNRELAEKVLSDIIASDQPRQITPKLILDATAEMFGFPVDELCGTSRRRPLVTARQVSMYVFRELTDFSYPAIAREFGGRDHTTVIHAVEKVSALMKERRQIYDQVTELIHRIKSGG